jgi:hypothetical protein
MDKINKLIRGIAGKPRYEWILGFIILFVMMLLTKTTVTLIEDLIVRVSPRSSYFDYQKIEYVKHDNSSLIFASTSIFKQSYPTEWNDIIRCNDGEQYSFYSNQDTKSASLVVRTDYRKVEWNYNKPFPLGKNCYLESTITMTVHGHAKVQKIFSDKFKIK